MTDKEQAQRLADVLDSAPLVTNGTMRSSAALLRTQADRIAALEAVIEQARVALEAWERAQETAAKYAHLVDARDSIVDAWVAADEKRDAALRAIEEVQHG